MVAALRSEFGPFNPCTKNNSSSIDQRNLWFFLRQADAIELNDLFRRLEKEKMYKIKLTILKHIVPIIADIDAGFEMKKLLIC
jgi:isocitrate lyase